MITKVCRLLSHYKSIQSLSRRSLMTTSESGGKSYWQNKLDLFLGRNKEVPDLPRCNDEAFGFYYRRYPELPVKDRRDIEIFSTVVWFFLFYLWYKQPEILVGHDDLPDPRKWSDEELGIPPA